MSDLVVFELTCGVGTFVSATAALALQVRQMKKKREESR